MDGVASARTTNGETLERGIRNSTLDALVREVYAQDLACGFGDAGPAGDAVAESET